MKHYFYVWMLQNMPVDPAELVKICRRYGIAGVAIKVLDGTVKYNTDGNNDKRLVAYIGALRAAGIGVELWGYHYPETAGLQGDMIMERVEKLGTAVYLADLEIEWEQPVGMPRAAETLFSKVKKGGLQVLMTGARFPKYFPQTPWSKLDNLEQVDGFDPQIYWLGAHNAKAQAERCWAEYRQFTDKPLIPAGPCWGEYVATANGPVWWEPSADEMAEFKAWADNTGINKVYWWSLDWPLTTNRMDLVSLATGVTPIEEPEEPPEEPEFAAYNAVVNRDKCIALNARYGPGIEYDHPFSFYAGTPLIVIDESESWARVKLPADVETWVHKGYLKAI